MNSTVIKLLGIILMVADHIGYYFPDLPCSRILRIIGRPCFIIFLFIFSESLFYTKSKKKYLLRLLIGYEVMLFAKFGFENLLPGKVALANNVFSMLFMSGIFACCTFVLVEAVKQKDSKKITAALFLHLIPFAMNIPEGLVLLREGLTVNAGGKITMLPILLTSIIPNFFNLESGLFYVFLGWAFCLAKKYGVAYANPIRFVLIAVTGAVLLIKSGGADIQWFLCLAILPLAFYNQKPGAGLKWFFYVFYPLHIFALYIISALYYK